MPKTSAYLLIISSLCLYQIVTAGDVSGKCPTATKIFTSKSSKSATEKVTGKTLCPSNNHERECCDPDTYKAMNTWWDDEGPLSMNRLWKTKIERVFNEFYIQWKKYYSKRAYEYATIVTFSDQYLKKTSPNRECEQAAKQVIDLDKLEAIDNAFKYFLETSSAKCWNYTITYLRGLACGMCDISFNDYKTKKALLITKAECQKFTTECGWHIKAYYTLFNYVKLFAKLADCKTDNQISDESAETYFPNTHIKRVEACLFENRKIVSLFVFKKNIDRQSSINKC